jgi:hypothetical protein
MGKNTGEKNMSETIGQIRLAEIRAEAVKEYKKWLTEQIQWKYDESDKLPGDLKDIRDLGRMDSLRWVLSLLKVK